MKTPTLSKRTGDQSITVFDELLGSGLPTFRASYIEEPKLVFGNNQLSVDPKSGIEDFGPYGCENRGEKTIRLAVVGTGQGIQEFLDFLNRSQNQLHAGFNTRKKPLDPHTFPDFPGIGSDRTFRAAFVADQPVFLKSIPEEYFRQATNEVNDQRRIEAVVRLINEQVIALADLEPAPDVVVLVLPADVERTCAALGSSFARQRVQLTPLQKFQRSVSKEAARKGQSLLALDFDLADEPSDTYFNIHHALKAHAMSTGLTTQVIWQSTLTDAFQASLAWNLFTALYYKAGNSPWKLQLLNESTCYVGVAFFKESPRAGADIQTSLAQVFGAGEGIVLKGEKAVFNRDRDRKAHLDESGAERLLTRALRSYEAQHNTSPKRVVVHKTSRYWPEELRGFRKGLGSIYHYDFLTLESGGTRFMRIGQKPPLRGTLIQLGVKHYLLFTNGYIPYLRCFPGKYIPRPLEILEHHGDSPAITVAQEVLALTKLNWNSSWFGSGLPITIRFARDVGKILTELPPNSVPETKYKFYM
jgi:hypothetical protein